MRGCPREPTKLANRWWARQDSNLGPMDYESTALTTELRALVGACVILQYWFGEAQSLVETLRLASGLLLLGVKHAERAASFGPD
jgi:hypothetical protein